MVDKYPHLYRAIMALGSTPDERAKKLGITARNLQRWFKRPPKYLTNTPIVILEAAIEDRKTQ